MNIGGGEWFPGSPSIWHIQTMIAGWFGDQCKELFDFHCVAEKLPSNVTVMCENVEGGITFDAIYDIQKTKRYGFRCGEGALFSAANVALVADACRTARPLYRIWLENCDHFQRLFEKALVVQPLSAPHDAMLREETGALQALVSWRGFFCWLLGMIGLIALGVPPFATAHRSIVWLRVFGVLLSALFVGWPVARVVFAQDS
jgi:hypothetical protein